jgi:hypothetical protein
MKVDDYLGLTHSNQLIKLDQFYLFFWSYLSG